MKELKSFSLTVEERVIDDFTAAFTYYNNVSIALSKNFSAKFYAAIHKISVNPITIISLLKD